MTQPEFSTGQQSPASPLSDQLKRRRGRPPVFTQEERAERAKKATQAAALATGILRQRHEKEYLELLAQAKKEKGL